MPESLKELINHLAAPYTFVGLAAVALILFLRYYRAATRPRFVIPATVLLLVYFILSLDDANFRAIITKPDNVPIVIMLFLVGFLTWLSFHKAARNDARLEAGEKPLEATEKYPRVFTWPDLVYIEFIATVFGTVLLIVWSIALKAPLEEPANPTFSPNPSKAPWYFLGLQELLVYFDPWIAGVLLPTLIIVGLCAIPYLDRNPKGSGYYTFRERRFAISVFSFGFLILWVCLIIMGTFLRGPNWNFFGPYEFWDVHKVEPLVNINLSEILWAHLLHQRPPDSWLVRESLGIVILLGYFVALPPLLAKTVFRKLYEQMGFARYNIMVFLLLIMVSVPIKMVLRWTINFKYLVAIPEYFFNI